VINGSNLRRAVSVLLAGMALFLFACQPGGTLPSKKIESGPDAFVMAEAYQKKENFKRHCPTIRPF
jgi:hypothetical protein